MASVYIIHCKNGEPCHYPMDEGLWTNCSFDRPTADNDLRRLDDPTRSQNARFLEQHDPHAFARWKGSVKSAKCGPHKVVEYRATS